MPRRKPLPPAAAQTPRAERSPQPDDGTSGRAISLRIVEQTDDDFHVLIFGDDDFQRPHSAAHRLISLVANGLQTDGCRVTLSCDPPTDGLPLVRRFLKSLRRVASLPQCDVVLYYGQGAPTLVALWLRCLRGPRLVPYVVEWPPAVPGRSAVSRANAVVFSYLVFRASRFSVVISQFLAERSWTTRRSNSVLKVPILCDPDVSADSAPSQRMNASRPPVLTYCADLDGYRSDAELVIDAACASGVEFTVRLVGRASNDTADLLLDRARRSGAVGRIDFFSEVSDSQLRELYVTSDVLLLPLDNSERSQARFPIKLADYLMSGRPVVTTVFGEPGALLTNGRNAYLAEDATAEAFTKAMTTALSDPRSSAVGLAGRRLAQLELSFIEHGKRLASFLYRASSRSTC